MPSFGRRPAPDPRDGRHLIGPRLALMSPRRRSRAWRRYRTLNQGNTGTCVGHAGRGAYEMEPRRHRPLIGPNEFWLYRECIKRDEWVDNDHEYLADIKDLQSGTSVRALFEVMTALGVFDRYLWTWDVNEVIDFVTREDGSPLILGTNWYDSMMEPDREGRVRVVEHRNPYGHAWIIRWAYRNGLLLCTNSWGDSWGRRGEFSLDPDDLQKLLNMNGECGMGVEIARPAA